MKQVLAADAFRGRPLSEELPWWGFCDDRVCLLRSGRLLAVSRVEPFVADGSDAETLDRVVSNWSRTLASLPSSGRLWWVVERSRLETPAASGALDIAGLARSKRAAYVAERARRHAVYVVWEFDRGVLRKMNEDPDAAIGARLLGLAQELLRRRRQPHLSVVVRRVLEEAVGEVRDELASLEARLSDLTRVSPVPAAEAAGVLYRIVNGVSEPWSPPAVLGHGLNWRLGMREVEITVRKGLRVGERRAQLYSLVSVPTLAVANCLDELYSLDADLSVVLEWRPMEKAMARAVIQNTRRHYFQGRYSMQAHMQDAAGTTEALEDVGASAEVEWIGEALVDLQQGGLSFGEVVMSVAVWGDTQREFELAGAEIERIMGSVDGKMIRETYGTAPVWFGRMPGQPRGLSGRTLMVSSALAAAVAPLAGPAVGHARCEHLDAPCLAEFETSWRTRYGFDLFGGGDVGHTLILGATGSGKSFFLNFLLMQALGYDPRILILDLGGSYRHLTQFVGGEYMGLDRGASLEAGSEGTAGFGLQPFGLPHSVRTTQFLVRWVVSLLAIGGYEAEGEDSTDVGERIEEIYRLPRERRTLGALRQSLPRTMWPALSRWVEGGPWARWFDGPPAAGDAGFGWWQVIDLEGADRYEDWCEAALWFFLERLRLVMDDEGERGRLKVMVVDEAWRYLSDPMVAGQLLEAAKTWRKRNGALVLATQSVGDVLKCGRQLLESLPTKVFLANPEFPDEAARVLELSAVDVRTIRELEPKRELFIRRADETSVVTLTVDPESYWLYTSDPVEAVRREKAIARWGLEGALMRLAAGVDEGEVGAKEVVS